MLTTQVFREAPSFTEIAFSRLLEWLDEGVPSNGERYLEIRRRLVSFFERRQCPDPDELADETFTRIARTLEEEGVIRTKPPAKYCYVVAKFVMLEDFRRQRKRAPLRETSTSFPSHDAPSREHRFTCLDRCLDELKPDQRAIVVDYYRDARREKIDRRRQMATRLGITMNALSIRVWRIREALTACMDRCGASLKPGM